MELFICYLHPGDKSLLERPTLLHTASHILPEGTNDYYNAREYMCITKLSLAIVYVYFLCLTAFTFRKSLLFARGC